MAIKPRIIMIFLGQLMADIETEPRANRRCLQSFRCRPNECRARQAVVLNNGWEPCVSRTRPTPRIERIANWSHVERMRSLPSWEVSVRGGGRRDVRA